MIINDITMISGLRRNGGRPRQRDVTAGTLSSKSLSLSYYCHHFNIIVIIIIIIHYRHNFYNNSTGLLKVHRELWAKGGVGQVSDLKKIFIQTLIQIFGN